MNINHIINKTNEISHVLSLDFFGFGESRLNDNYIDNDEIPIPG